VRFFYNRVQPSLFIAIDPGASGAYVIRRPDGTLSQIGEYGDPQDVVKVCAYLRANNLSVFPIVAVIEKVWGSPVMGVSAAFAFGENYGGWCMAMRVAGIPLFGVTPQAWQKVVAADVVGQGPERKRQLKARAAALFPDYRVTLATADALLLSQYCVEQFRAGAPLGEPL